MPYSTMLRVGYLNRMISIHGVAMKLLLQRKPGVSLPRLALVISREERNRCNPT